MSLHDDMIKIIDLELEKEKLEGEINNLEKATSIAPEVTFQISAAAEIIYENNKMLVKLKDKVALKERDIEKRKELLKLHIGNLLNQPVLYTGKYVGTYKLNYYLTASLDTNGGFIVRRDIV